MTKDLHRMRLPVSPVRERWFEYRARLALSDGLPGVRPVDAFGRSHRFPDTRFRE